MSLPLIVCSLFSITDSPFKRKLESAIQSSLVDTNSSQNSSGKLLVACFVHFVSICMKMYCNVFLFKVWESVFLSDIVLLLMHRLKIEMERVYRGLSDLPCINCYYIKPNSGSWIIIIPLHTKMIKLQTLFSLLFGFDNSEKHIRQDTRK